MNMINKIDHFSVSSVQKWADCPRSWWSKYILDMDLPSSEAASFGSQYDQLIGERLGFKSAKPVGELVEGVEDAVAGYFSQPHAIKKASGAQVEIRITPEQWAIFGEMHDVCAEITKPITGYIDLCVDFESKLVDLKTSQRAGMNGKWAFQVLIYALAKQFCQARIHLMTRTKTPAFYDYMVFVHKATLGWAISNFTFYARQIETALVEGHGELARNPDYYCSWCAEKLTCPAKSAFGGC
jgi:hypothetical protein